MFSTSLIYSRMDLYKIKKNSGQEVHYHFSSHFCHCPGHRKGLEDKTYPAMDLPVHAESDGASYISVEDCIPKLWPFNLVPVV